MCVDECECGRVWASVGRVRGYEWASVGECATEGEGGRGWAARLALIHDQRMEFAAGADEG